MSVAGVALATIISQYLSAIVVVIILFKKKGVSYGLSLDKFSINGSVLKRILRFGIPTGLQGALFNFSNVLLMSGINTLPPTSVTANTIASNIDGITYLAGNCFLQTSMTFAGQNYGAKRLDRLKRVLIYGLIQVTIFTSLVASIELLFQQQLASLYIDPADPNAAEVLEISLEVIGLLVPLYFLCGVQEVFSGTLRGFGYSVSPMLVCIFGVCGVRLFWLYFIFNIPSMHNLKGLVACYPASWAATICGLALLFVVAYRSVRKKLFPRTTADKVG
jgi:Na+-driven multidrug efflux pump